MISQNMMCISAWLVIWPSWCTEATGSNQ